VFSYHIFSLSLCLLSWKKSEACTVDPWYP
jgi:hypothetical protein